MFSATTTELAIAHALGGEAGAAHAEDEANVRVLWGDHGGYDVSRSTHFDVPYAAATAIGDLDGDGKLDLAVAVHQGAETYKSESAIFYGRDNLLFSPRMGPVPGNRFGSVIENLDEMVKACDNVWREGFAGERLTFSRVD